MPKIDQKTVQYLTQLSRIACSEKEQEKLLKDLQQIVDYIDLMQEIDTEGLTPCYQVLDESVNVMREDTIGEILPRDVFLDNAPAHKEGMIIVPPVIKNSQ